MACSLERENLLRKTGSRWIAGVDEAGRGPLAGPVFAAAVVLPPGFRLERLDDSKKLTDRVRRELFAVLVGHPEVRWGVGVATVAEIDRMNILRAAQEAMRRAVAALPMNICHALIDGLPVRPFPVPQTAVIGGDRSSLSIAAASILAKVRRDDEMLALDREFPEYGFAAHKGYGTPVHLDALRRLGPCPAHRRTFAPVAKSAYPSS